MIHQGHMGLFEIGEDSGIFTADDTRSYYGKPFREFLEIQDAVRVKNLLLIHFDIGQTSGF